MGHQLTLVALPVSFVAAQGPLLRDLEHFQIIHLVNRLIGRKNPMIARHLPKDHVQQLNNVGGVDDPSDVFCEGKYTQRETLPE